MKLTVQLTTATNNQQVRKQSFVWDVDTQPNTSGLDCSDHEFIKIQFVAIETDNFTVQLELLHYCATLKMA